MKKKLAASIISGVTLCNLIFYNYDPTCNPVPTFWPIEISGPTEWGEPCWVDIAEYTVYGEVTVGEDTPLQGAEVRVNRIVGSAQTGAGAAISNANGEYWIEVDGNADALRIYVIYPPEYEAWGVTAPVGSWGLELIHWPNPPASCGPIWWKAAYKETPAATVTVTPSQTPAPTQTPTRTATWIPTLTWTPTRTATQVPTLTATATLAPTQTQEPTQTSIPTTSIPTLTPTATPLMIPTPPPQPPMPDTMLGVAQEQLRVTWRLEKLLYVVSMIVTAGIAYVIKLIREGNLKD